MAPLSIRSDDNDQVHSLPRKITTKNHSLEHVIPQSIGGRLKVGGFICKRCNEQAGAEWDRPLFDQFHWFSVTLDIKRESGKAPGPIKVNTVDGRTFKLSADGTMVPAIPTKPALADDGKTISFRQGIGRRRGNSLVDLSAASRNWMWTRFLVSCRN